MRQSAFFGLFFVPSLLAVLDVSWWSSVAQLSTQNLLAGSGARAECEEIAGLSPGQRSSCEVFRDHMPAVGAGAHAAIVVCQQIFANNRWNCSTPSRAHFGPVHKLGTKEAAYTYAILSAGVTHEISRRCRQGRLGSCGCANDPRPKNLPPEWAWTGCGDNVDYGSRFAKEFIDVRENESPKRSTDAGRRLVNRWNNEAGRKLLMQLRKKKCKCHGVSGACNLRTCWLQLPALDDMGRLLEDRYHKARKVMVNNRGNLQFVSDDRPKGERTQKKRHVDLVYLDDSPDYCRYDRTLGTLGTQGRVCRRDSTGHDGCDSLCCGRGHDTVRTTTECDCKFVWCCQVTCQQCTNTTTICK